MTGSCSTTAWAAATSSEQLSSLLREVTRSLRANVDRRLEPMGLSQAQWRPLLALHTAGGPLTQTELARVLEIEAPSLVRLLDRLAEKDWIERRSAAGDRRVRQVFLTPGALALIEQILPVVHDVRKEAFAGLSPAELDACLSVLGKIRDNVRAPLPQS